MGNISFYNTGATPIFNPFELAQYSTSFSEIVLNVTWAQLQTSQGSLDTSFIDSAIQQVNQFNDTYHTDLGIKLRVWGGFTAPIWVKEINGAPITVTGQNAVDPGSYASQTIGRFWTADYINAWQNLQNALATKYDGMAIIRGISQTAGAYATDEPFVPLKTNAAVSSNPADGTVNQIAQLQMGGFNDAGEMLTLRAAIADYYQWSTTPLDYTFNEFHLFDSGNELADGNFTLAVLQQARNSARIVQAGNHAIRNPQYAPDDVVYGQLAQDAAVKPGAVVNSFQTAAPIILADYAGWQGAIANGVLWNGGNIELWDFPTPPAQPNGFLSFSPQQVQDLAAILSAGSPPPNAGAPDDGSALSWIAPGSVTGAPGRIAFTGTDAVLLASANPGASYGVSLTSLNGGTLGIGGLTGLFSATSGTTLSFGGSLSMVNTLLANVTDTLAGGTDIVRIVATDSGGNFAVRDVGVQTAPPVAPLVVTPGLLTADQTFGFAGGSALVVGQGQGGTFDVAGQLGNSGILLVAGVQSQFSLSGDLELDGNTSLIAALSPNAYSTANLAIGGALSVDTGSSTYFSGTLAAASINNTGGTIRGNGTLDATGGASIGNTGTIEAVADFTLGSQRLVVADSLTGTGKLLIDAGATMVLSGQVQDQTITFADNTARQFVSTVYSPSTLVLGQPGQLTGTTSIEGFTFADRLVLENVTLSTTAATPVAYDSGTNTLTVTLAGGATLSYSLTGSLPSSLTGLQAQGTQAGTSIVVGFVAPSAGIAPQVGAPDTLALAVGTPVHVPGVVLQAPLPANTAPASVSFTVTVTANAGGKVSVEGTRFESSITLTGTLGELQTQLQTLMYSAGAGASPRIEIAISHGLWGSGSTSITVDNSGGGIFQWTDAAGDNDFTNIANWNIGGSSTPPGGTNTALFAAGNNTAMGDGAVGQILNLGKTILTGNITAQGLAGATSAVVVDSGGALVLTGGASLNAQQQVTVGGSGQGFLTVAGGALALAGQNSASSTVYLVVGGAGGSSGTVLNLELITATGQAVIGGAGTGTLELLGIASTLIDGGAVIGQSAGGRGSVIVNGGEWTNNGLLTVGDAGMGSLTINGMNRGITGQVTAWSAAIGNQVTGQGTVTLDGGELLVANVFSPSSTLVVGNLGNGTLVMENGSEVAVGAAQGQVGNNTGTLIVGGANGTGAGLVRIGAYSSLLVYGDSMIGDGAGPGRVIVGRDTDEGAVFSTSGTLDVGAHGQVTVGGTDATLRAANIEVVAGGSISGTGTVSGLGGGNRTVALAEIDNDGTISAEGGNLLLYGSVDGTGTLGIGNNATLTLQAAVETTQTLSFGNNSKAVLNDVRAFQGTINGFGSDDVLDLSGIQATNPIWADGVLTLDTPFGQIFLSIAGPYFRNSFSVMADGLGGTFVSGGYGDVHIVSLDGFAYDFQAVGEYVAARGGTSWQVQIQTDGQHGVASWTTGLAAQFGDIAVVFGVGKPITLHVDGAPDIVLKDDVAHVLSGGTLTPLSADSWRVSWNSGETITVSEQGICLDWQVSARDPASVQGLLGPSSAPWSYLWLPDGTMTRQAWSNDQIVGAYADSWRVSHSLFEHDHAPL